MGSCGVPAACDHPATACEQCPAGTQAIALEIFPDGQLMTPAQQAILQGFLADRGLGSGVVWTMCYNSHVHPKDDPSEWHSRCDGHARTVVVGTNQHGFLYGGYGSDWSGSGYQNDDAGQFIFRLAGPGLGAEAWDDTGSSTNFQYNHAGWWPIFGEGNDLIFGTGNALGAHNAYCNQNTYQAASNAVCGGGVSGSGHTYGLGAWGESEMEMWFASDAPPNLCTSHSFVAGAGFTAAAMPARVSMRLGLVPLA